MKKIINRAVQLLRLKSKLYHEIESFLYYEPCCGFNFNIRKNKFRKFLDKRTIRKNLFRKLRPFWTSHPQKFLLHIFFSQTISSLKVLVIILELCFCFLQENYDKMAIFSTFFQYFLKVFHQYFNIYFAYSGIPSL